MLIIGALNYFMGSSPGLFWIYLALPATFFLLGADEEEKKKKKEEEG
ncbi:hypothetical protein [Alkalicoccobacillus gibsonii]|nr:hypothetical protein [Alkalicoccobacillus gibsonii]